LPKGGTPDTPTLSSYTDTSISLNWTGSYDSYNLEISKNDSLNFELAYPHSI
jgi:hypothetical protein